VTYLISIHDPNRSKLFYDTHKMRKKTSQQQTFNDKSHVKYCMSGVSTAATTQTPTCGSREKQAHESATDDMQASKKTKCQQCQHARIADLACNDGPITNFVVKSRCDKSLIVVTLFPAIERYCWGEKTSSLFPCVSPHTSKQMRRHCHQHLLVVFLEALQS